MFDYINEILKNFSGKTFEEFVEYFYFSIENKISSNKNKVFKDKYIKIRKNFLEYIIKNKRLIVKEINKKNKKNK
jgi:hypothetical protein